MMKQCVEKSLGGTPVHPSKRRPSYNLTANSSTKHVTGVVALPKSSTPSYIIPAITLACIVFTAIIAGVHYNVPILGLQRRTGYTATFQVSPIYPDAKSHILQGENFDNCSSVGKYEYWLESEEQAGTFVLKTSGQDRLLLFAGMNTTDRHFGCFLQYRQGNAYYCPEAALLSAGEWDVRILMMRSQCTTSHSGENVPILDYIKQHNISSFSEMENIFYYNNGAIAQVHNFKWSSSLSKTIPYGRKPVCSKDMSGEWVRLTPEVQSAAPQALAGLDIQIFNNQLANERGMHHVFSPFACDYKIYSAEEARECIPRTGLTLIGDSRTFGLYNHFKAWLGRNSTVAFMDWIYMPYYHGLNRLKNDPSVLAQFDALLASNRTLVLHSMLHDVVDFRYDVITSQIHKYWGLCLDCKAKFVGDCPSPCNKQYTIQTYMSNIEWLADYIARKRRRRTIDKVFWTSQYRAQPYNNSKMMRGFATEPGMVYAVEQRALDIMQRSGIAPIDFMPHVLSAPPEWWDDDGRHYVGDGGGNTPSEKGLSMFKHMSAQILLNHVCKE